MPNAKIRKGVKVWWFRSWDNKAAYYARLLTIQSFGKVQGTATYAASNGKFLKANIYAPYEGIVAAADVADVNEYGLEWAKADHARRIKLEEDRIEWCLQREREHMTYAHSIEDLKHNVELLRALTPTFFVKEF